MALDGGGTALITGAARGIGRAVAVALGRRGHPLWLADVAESGLAATCRALRADGIDATPVACDLADAAALAALAARAADAPVEILVNNAKSEEPTAPLWELRTAEVSRAFAVNLAAPTELCRRLLPGMLARGRGTIVNLGSQATRVPLAFIAPYAASKSGLHALTRSLQQETYGSGVLVTLAEPGPVSSEGYRRAELALLPRGGRTRRAVRPEAFAAALLRALDRGKPHLVYPPFDPLAALAALLVPGPMARALALDQSRRWAGRQGQQCAQPSANQQRSP